MRNVTSTPNLPLRISQIFKYIVFIKTFYYTLLYSLMKLIDTTSYIPRLSVLSEPTLTKFTNYSTNYYFINHIYQQMKINFWTKTLKLLKCSFEQFCTMKTLPVDVKSAKNSNGTSNRMHCSYTQPTSWNRLSVFKSPLSIEWIENLFRVGFIGTWN